MGILPPEVLPTLLDVVLNEIAELADEIREGDLDIEDVIDAVFDIVGPVAAAAIPGSFDDAFIKGLAEQLKEKAIEMLQDDRESLIEKAEKKEARAVQKLELAAAARLEGKEGKAERLERVAARLQATAAELRDEAEALILV